VERVKETEMWKRSERNMGKRSEEDKSMKGVKEVGKKSEGLRYERNYYLLNFSGYYISKT
jgi:hypothetical protein